MSNSISTETLHEAQIITAEIWQSASSAEIMLTMLSESRLFQNSNHYMPQLYLFAASCARRVSHLLQDPRSQQAIRAAELFATDSTTKTQLHHSHRAAQAAVIDLAKGTRILLPHLQINQTTPQPLLAKLFRRRSLTCSRSRIRGLHPFRNHRTTPSRRNIGSLRHQRFVLRTTQQRLRLNIDIPNNR